MRSDGKGRAGTTSGACAGSVLIPFPVRRGRGDEGVGLRLQPVDAGDDPRPVGVDGGLLGVVHVVHGELVDAQVAQRVQLLDVRLGAVPIRQNRSTISSGTNVGVRVAGPAVVRRSRSPRGP